MEEHLSKKWKILFTIPNFDTAGSGKALLKVANNLDINKYRTDFRMEGSSNYALNLILQHADIPFTERLMMKMREEKIEYRRGSAGGGNQLRQPYLRKLLRDTYQNFHEVDHIHFNGFYIGNFPSLEEKKILRLCEILNSVK